MECNKYVAICQWPPGKGSWLMIDTYTPEYICSYTVYIYIYKCACVIYIHSIYLYQKAGDNSILSHVQLHTSSGMNTRTKKHVHHVGELLVQNATVTDFSHVASRLCQTSLPKNLKNSAFGTSTNHLAKRKTRQAHSHEGNFSGQVLGVFLYLSWTIDFETLKPSF